jgi:hypothetical protein
MDYKGYICKECAYHSVGALGQSNCMHPSHKVYVLTWGYSPACAKFELASAK